MPEYRQPQTQYYPMAGRLDNELIRDTRIFIPNGQLFTTCKQAGGFHEIRLKSGKNKSRIDSRDLLLVAIPPYYLFSITALMHRTGLLNSFVVFTT
jgi:hypothetical protein